MLCFTCGVLPLDLLGVGRCYWKRSLTSYLVGEMELATFVGCLEFSSVLLMSTVWRELNCRMFEDVETAGTQFLALFSGSLFNWS